MPVGGKIASETVDAENVESQPLFTGERFSTEKDSQKVQGPGTDGTSRLLPLYLHFRVRARLDTCPDVGR
jgi:hypothetical protein